MEDTKMTLDLLRQIEEINRRQLWLERIRCLFSLVAAGCCIAVVVIVARVVPQVTELIGRIQVLLVNVETAAEELAALDLEGMVSNVDALVTSARESLTQTTQKLNSLDIETLNQAIEDLAAVIEPLAKLFR